MGHMDDDNIDHHTITVRWQSGDATPETFHGCTDVETNEDTITFECDSKHHEYNGVSYHIVTE